MSSLALEENTHHQIKQSVELLQKLFKGDLLGVYLYGSSVVGGLQRYSDIDLFVVIGRSMTQQEKEGLVEGLLQISGVYRSIEKRPIEMTVVIESEINPWHYPPSFEFQYGDWLRGDFEAGNREPWPTKVSPDLALLITQVLLASRVVHGAPAPQLLPQVPYQDFMIALTDGISLLRQDLLTDTRNVLLTLARIWMTAETDIIASKQTAAAWAMERLPETHKPILEHALETALGKQDENWEAVQGTLAGCADFMIDQIRNRMQEIEVDRNASRKISLTA